jgi:hypothetical protein
MERELIRACRLDCDSEKSLTSFLGNRRFDCTLQRKVDLRESPVQSTRVLPMRGPGRPNPSVRPPRASSKAMAEKGREERATRSMRIHFVLQSKRKLGPCQEPNFARNHFPRVHRGIKCFRLACEPARKEPHEDRSQETPPGTGFGQRSIRDMHDSAHFRGTNQIICCTWADPWQGREKKSPTPGMHSLFDGFMEVRPMK